MPNHGSLNHIFRSVWNEALGAMVAVPEFASCSAGTCSSCKDAKKTAHVRFGKISRLVFGVALAWGLIAPIAQANPVGGVAVHGQINLVSTAKTLNVTTQNGAGTSHSAINWQSFSIPAGNATYFQQPSAVSTVINRVVTNTPSLIFGSLSSNGKLVLVNHAGITVGAGAVVDTAGFTASALRMTDADAISGRMRFGDGSLSVAGISVQGSILARSGDVVLVAPNIDTGKDALIQAPNGSTLLAAGRQIEITGRGFEGITLQVQAPADSALNLGTLKGNAVAIFAGTLNHSGDIQANSVSMDGGKIVLKAVGDALVEGSGKLTAKGTASGAMGGTVDLLGSRVALNDQAVIDVSGDAGGGTVRIGGGLRGKNADIQNAEFTYTGAQTSIKADALTKGNGGKVIVWANDTTRAYSYISAKGGAQSGNGGFVETSGKRGLDVAAARVDTSASNGANGEWLLDPTDITIFHEVRPVGEVSSPPISSSEVSFSPISSSEISDAQINAALASTDVTIQTIDGAIVVNGTGNRAGAATINSTYGGLTLNAGGSIDILPGSSIRVPSLYLTGNSIRGTGAIVTPYLQTQSSAGTSLNGNLNSISSLAANNSGTGNIELANSGFLALNSIINSGGTISVNSTNGISVNGDIRATDAITLAAGSGDLTQISGNISNVSQGNEGQSGMSLSGNNITLRGVQSAGGVMLNALGSVNLLGLGSGGFIDDTFFAYNLPFTFNYFGADYNQAFITTNGLITFGVGSATSEYTDSTTRLGQLRAIAPAWNDWILQANEGKDIRISPSANSLGVRWNVGRYGDQSRTAQFESILSPNGAIRFNYGAANDSFANPYGYGIDVTIGISNGNGINLTSALMSEPNFSMNNLRSTTFTPNGQGSYTETLAAGSTPLSVFGTISGSAILGQGTGEIITAAGALDINAGGRIDAPSMLRAQSLQFHSVGGALFTGDNLFGSIGPSANTGSASDVLIYNTRGDSGSPLAMAGLSNSAGAIIVNTTGGIELSGRLDASGEVALTAQTGAITQTRASTGIFSPSLITSSSGGTALAYSGNQVGSFSANNAGSGNVELVTSGPLVVGSITNPLGRVLISDSSGDMSLGAITASSITLSALAGGISQTAGLSTAGLLTASSRDGVLLDQTNNSVGSFRASTAGLGDIRLTNVGAIDIQGINASNGNIVVNNTGGISTSGAVTAPEGRNIDMTANSPLTIGSAGVLAGGNINLTATNLTSAGNVTLNGPITSSGGSITMVAASSFTQNSAVSAAGGVTANAGSGFTFGPSATTAGNPVVYRVGATQQQPPPSPTPPQSPTPATFVATAPTPQPVSSSPTDFVVAFLSNLEALLTEEYSDTDKTKKTKDDIVIGAQSCSR